MADEDRADELRRAERRLQAAQLAGDADALDQLLDDRLIFTLGVDANRYTKSDDLRLQRSKEQVLNSLSEEALLVLVDGNTGVTWFTGTLKGVFRGDEFVARMHSDRQAESRPQAAQLGARPLLAPSRVSEHPPVRRTPALRW